MQNKTILLHIGTAKTGSTSIQKWLADAQERGYLKQVSYPLWGRSHNQQRLVSLYKNYEELPLPMRPSFGREGDHYERTRNHYQKFLFKELRAERNAVLSGESLCAVLSPQQIKQLRQDLETMGFREFHIVLYVRDPADFYLSSTQQAMKMAFKPPFIRDLERFKYDFLNWAQAWEETFPGKLIVRKFPPEKHRDIIEDFSAVLEERMGLRIPWVPMKMNASLSAEGMHILQTYRETFSENQELLTPDAQKLIAFLERSNQTLPQTKPVLKQEIAELIRAHHKQDASALKVKYGIDLGLENFDTKPARPLIATPRRVADIVESIDPDVVQRLLLLIAKKEFSRSRPLALRIAAGLYRQIPMSLHTKRLDTWLRRFFWAD